VTAFIQPHSRKPTRNPSRNPVAKTSGIALNSSDSGYNAGTALDKGATNLCSNLIPGINVSFINYTFTHSVLIARGNRP